MVKGVATQLGSQHCHAQAYYHQTASVWLVYFRGFKMRCDSHRILAETYNPFCQRRSQACISNYTATDAIANSNTGNFDSVHFNIESS
jgi:hypothetical protein